MERTMLMELERKMQVLELDCKKLEDEIKEKLDHVENSLANPEELYDKKALYELTDELKAADKLRNQLLTKSLCDSELMNPDEFNRYLDFKSIVVFRSPNFAPLKLIYELRHADEVREYLAICDILDKRLPYLHSVTAANERIKKLTNELGAFVSSIRSKIEVLPIATMVASAMASALDSLGEEMDYDPALNVLPRKWFNDILAHPEVAKQALIDMRDELEKGA